MLKLHLNTTFNNTLLTVWFTEHFVSDANVFKRQIWLHILSVNQGIIIFFH